MPHGFQPSHNFNSASSSHGKVSAAQGVRQKINGLNLPGIQTLSLPSDLRHETIIIPSTSLPAFGSFFIIDIKDRNIVLNNITLQFITSAISGTYTGTAIFNPCINWFTRIEIVMGGIVIDQIFPNEQFLRNQLLQDDEDRVSTTIAMGRYDNSVKRTIMSSTTTTNTFYCPLRVSWINEWYAFNLMSSILIIAEGGSNLVTLQNALHERMVATGVPVVAVILLAKVSIYTLS